MARTKAGLRRQHRGKVLGSRKLTYRQKREVKNIIGRRIETKVAVTYQSGVSVTSSPGIYDLCSSSYWNIAQGTAQGKRIGDEIRLKKIHLRWGALGGDYFNTMRIILFRFNGSNATAPVIGDILDGTGEEYVFAPLNWDTRHRYHIIYDRVIALNQTNTFNSSGTAQSAVIDTSNSWKVMRPINLFGKKLGKKSVSWDAGSASTGEDHVYLLVISDSVITPNPQLFYTVQVFYTDA